MIKKIISNHLGNEKVLFISMITFVLFILPLTWLPIGEMDLGGDSNRLYFYDPAAQLISFAIYSVVPYGTGDIYNNQYFLPYLALLSAIKIIIPSSSILIAIFNGLKLAGSFLFMVLIIKELLSKSFKALSIGELAAAIIAALFYTFSPAVLVNMKFALVTHDLVFINPLIFYLLLQSLKKSSLKYLWSAIFISALFSSSFALFNPPTMAFYPLSIIFLLLYNQFVLRKQFPWKGVLLGTTFFLFIHSFHILPVVVNVFNPETEYNQRIFESASDVNPGLEYFNAILGNGKVSRNILSPLPDMHLTWSLIFIPLLTVLGLFCTPKNNRLLLLTGGFFLATLFLVSANITHIGVSFYRSLFSIPGFGMFRGFFGQWQWVFAFYYALFSGLCISYFFSKLKNSRVYIISAVVICMLLFRSLIVFNGDIVDVKRDSPHDVKVAIKMDSHYEDILRYIRTKLPEGKIIQMPFTDYSYNIVGGVNNGVYIGPSMISQLTGKSDYSGYQQIDPYSEVFVKLVKERRYDLMKYMFSLLNIRYILYNSDVRVSSEYFPGFPYGHNGVPTSQNELKKFVDQLATREVYQSGTFSLREVDSPYLPQIYIASKVFIYDANQEYDKQYSKASSFFPDEYLPLDKDNAAVLYLDRDDCVKILASDSCVTDEIQSDADMIQITYKKINPTKYELHISEVTKPVFLVFLSKYSPPWKLLDRDKEVVFDKTHTSVNGYANAWYIDKNFDGTLEMTGQNIVYQSMIISAVSFIVFLLFGLYIIIKK